MGRESGASAVDAQGHRSARIKIDAMRYKRGSAGKGVGNDVAADRYTMKPTPAGTARAIALICAKNAASDRLRRTSSSALSNSRV